MTYQKIGKTVRQIGAQHAPAFELSKEQAELLSGASRLALALIAGAGIIALSAVAPNIFVAVDKIARLKGKRLTHREKEIKTARTFYYLKSSGQIKMKADGKGLKLVLTALGRQNLAKINFEALRVAKAKKWDGKWWQIAADIPTLTHRIKADGFRKKLKEMDFFALQRTLWFYPFDPRKEIEFLTNHYQINHYVTAMEINKMDADDEAKLKRHFRAKGIL